MNNAAFNFKGSTPRVSSPQALMQTLIQLWQDRRHEACFELAQKIVAEYPQQGLAWKLLGVLYPMFGQPEQALPALLAAQKQLPKDAEVAFNLGNAYAKAEDFSAAVQAYKKAIKLSPMFAQAYENLGSVLHLQNALDEAKKAFAKAIAYAPASALAHAELALILHKQGKPKQAMPYYRQALQLNSQDAVSHYNLAQALEDVGDDAAAQVSYETALKLQPDYTDALFNLGYLHKRHKAFDLANAYFAQILSLAPDHVRAAHVLADSYLETGDVHHFVQTYLKAVGEGEAFSPEKMNDMVAMLLDKGLPDEAEQYCRMAMEKAPDNPLILNNMGLICYARNDPYAAIAYFEKAIEHKPDFAPPYSNGALPLLRVGRVNEAMTYLHKAIACNPEYFAAYVNLGMAYSDFGNIPQALDYLEQALKIKPDNIKPIQSILFLSAYHPDKINQRYFELLSTFGNLTAETAKPFNHWRIQRNAPRLKIGFVSGDLKHHPVGLFLKPVLSHLDQSRFDVFVYSNSVLEDHVTGSLKSLVSSWQVIAHLNDEMAARKIQEDGIHILIDLSGHTSLNRLPMFAWKPAPMQMTWLGYWASTGMPSMDYLIADEVSVPTTAHAQFSEKVAYLPNTRMCFSQPMHAVPVSTLPALHNGFVTLGCYHKYTKATDEVIALWSAVMQALPEAKLRWQTTAFGDAQMVEAAKARFAAFGIGEARCQFLPAVSVEAYLQSHAEVDFILDTFPFTGGTTTCDALWMGVPTLTIVGAHLISRQGASLMSAAGLTDWVVTDQDSFVQKSVQFASDLPALAELRADLRPRLQHSALFNGAQFTADFASLLERLWQQQADTLGSEVWQGVTPLANAAPLWVVSATQQSEHDFWAQTALGRSLRRHMQKDARISAHIAYAHQDGWSGVYNQAIQSAPEDALLLLVHDDVWLDATDLFDSIQQGLQQFDVMGVVGNQRCQPMQPSWHETNLSFEQENAAFLLGAISHGKDAFGKSKYFSARQGVARLLDGAALATSKRALSHANIGFDLAFASDFYDMDFCRSAHAAGLKLGVWPLAITRQQLGAVRTGAWFTQLQAYLQKWDDPKVLVQAPLSEELKAVVDEVFNHAMQAHQAGEVSLASQLYHEILSVHAHHDLALHNLALIEWGPEASEEALALALQRFQQAYQAMPEAWQLLSSYVTALAHCGQLETASNVLKQAQGHDAQQLTNLSAELGLEVAPKSESASQSPTQQTAPSEEMQQALLALMDAQDYAGLTQQLESLLREYPAWLDGWKWLSDGLMLQKKDASEAAQQALALNPDDPREHCYYGLVLKSQGKLSAAAQAFAQAVALKPDYAAAYNNWGLVLKELGQAETAITKFEQALQLQPEYAECFSNLLFCLSHVDGISPAQLLDLHQAYADRYEQPVKGQWPQHRNRKDTERILKIGFVSADFRAHSMAHFLLPILPLLAQQPMLQLYAYANQTLADDVTQQMQHSFAVWRSVDALSDAALAAQIMQDEIDILIDLSGHTSGNRLRTFALKPAPIQISWLGYLHSTGLSAMDYYLADALLAPTGLMEQQFTEQLVQLPVLGSFAPHPESPEINTLPALHNGYMTFGCFNRSNKITPETLHIWAELLHALPDSRLLIAGADDMDHDAFIAQGLEAEGIATTRLSFAGRCDVVTYLQRHQQVDICLDTTPSSGVTTTAHALWMGVPTLCLSAETLRGRGAMALMQHAGLQDWVATDVSDFVAKGLAFSQQIPALAALRTTLRTRLADSGLMQAGPVVQALVAAWQTMWQHWCAGLDAHAWQGDGGVAQQADAEQAMHEVLRHALELMTQERYEEAAQMLREIIQVEPNHAEANYQLGLIETHTLGAHQALPRFEKAVSNCPTVEQYWVSYIDAMVMADETIIARHAITEAIRFALTPEVATLLLDELDQSIQLKNASLIAPEHQLQATKFLIVAPAYTDKSFGIMVLHELCDSLNKRGYQTALYFIAPSGFMITHQPQYYAPHLGWYRLSGEAEAQQFIDEGVVIYPEVIKGNPLHAKQVVRYVLNAEGAITGHSMQMADTDFVLAFSEEFHSAPHAVLKKITLESQFNEVDTLPALERPLDLTYIGKGHGYQDCSVLPGSLEITRTWPQTKRELALLFKKTRYLYTWDIRSKTVLDAVMCGVIPIFMSPKPYDDFNAIDANALPYQFQAQVHLAEDEVTVTLPNHYQAILDDFKQQWQVLVNDYDQSLDRVLVQLFRHFKLERTHDDESR